jgi:sulfide:quinone oxidoreductase
MAKVLIVGGGFAGVVAAESLAKKLGKDDEITLVSASRKFLFYPALVRLAFGKCERSEIEFDVRDALLDRRVRFVEGEVARINTDERVLTFARGDFSGRMPYDYLLLALGRRLKTEQITGFFEYAHHLMDARAATVFGRAAALFNKGRAVIGHCPAARLPVPIFETAFALSHLLEERGRRDDCTITIVSSEPTDEMFGGIPISHALTNALKSHRIELVSDFAINQVTRDSIISRDGRSLGCELNMLIPPFVGPAALVGTGLTDAEGFARVDTMMRVAGLERVYAAGDCINLKGPKMGHMAVRQGEVAAENIAVEIHGLAPRETYDHQLMLVIDAGGDESIFAKKDLWTGEPADIQHSRFWGWAKRKQQQFWKAKHA